MKQFNYLPHREKDRKEILKTLCLKSVKELFLCIPEELKNSSNFLKNPLSEIELETKLLKLTSKNVSTEEYISFLGGGCTNRYIPAVVEHITSRVEFFTPYTPYQPEVSQGTLQALYEYQSMICSITGMDVSNASMYDVSTATAEAIFMACGITKKQKAIICGTINPETQQVIKTYMNGKEITITTTNITNGITSIEDISNKTDNETACLVVEMPNFLGNIEKIREIQEIAQTNKALLIVITDPLSLGILKPPGKYNADIVVGNGQSLGCNLMFGGPHFGFMACKSKYMRQLPGRIVGATEDANGERVFTLTLQAREQHIRREKATSNICSNHSLNAINACIYLSTIGPEGLKEIANLSFQQAHYLAKKIEEIPGFKVPFTNFFNEFVVLLPKSLQPEKFLERMLSKKIIAGLDISKDYPSFQNAILISVTEKNTLSDIFIFLEELKIVSKEVINLTTGV